MAMELRKDFNDKIVKYDIKDLVIKDGNILSWIFEDPLDRFQKDLYNYCISRIQPTDDPNQVFSVVFDVNHFCKRHKIKTPGSYKRHFFESMIKLAQESPRIWIHDSSTEDGMFINIFSGAHYSKRKGTVNVVLNNYIHACYIARKIKTGSLRYTMDELTALKTFNATRLADCILKTHMEHNLDNDGKYYICERSIDNLGQVFKYDMTKRTSVGDFKRRVLSSSIKDLNDNSSIEFSKDTPISIKKGRKVVAFAFKYRFKEDKLTPVILDNDPQLSLFNSNDMTATKQIAKKIAANEYDIDENRQIPNKEDMLAHIKNEYNSIIGKGLQRLEDKDAMYLFKLYVFVKLRFAQEMHKRTGKLQNPIECAKYINWCTSHEALIKISSKKLNDMILEYNTLLTHDGFDIYKTPFEHKYM